MFLMGGIRYSFDRKLKQHGYVFRQKATEEVMIWAQLIEDILIEPFRISESIKINTI